MTKRRILVIGSANTDLVAFTPHCPRPGESVIGSAFKTINGGKGANQAVACARLGAKTLFAGCVGDDGFGQMQRDSLASAGVDISHLRSDPQAPTGTALICVGDDGQNTIAIIPAANHSMGPEHMRDLRETIRNVDAVLLQLEIRLDTVEAALDIAAEEGVLSVLDVGHAQKVPESIISKTGIISPNETEAEAITDISIGSLDDARRAAQAIRGMGAREVVIKLGATGSLYVGEEDVFVPAFDIKVVDTTAAGDAFTAALTRAWGTVPRRQAMAFASAAGALAATVAGAQPSMPTLDAVNVFLRERGETTLD